MISFAFDPPAVFDVNKSYATSATILPEYEIDHFHVDYNARISTVNAHAGILDDIALTDIDLIELSCLFNPLFN